LASAAIVTFLASYSPNTAAARLGTRNTRVLIIAPVPPDARGSKCSSPRFAPGKIGLVKGRLERDLDRAREELKRTEFRDLAALNRVYEAERRLAESTR
jgi:hypothetical protein